MKRLTILSLILSACVPDVDVDESLLAAPRLLAIRAEPAEAGPGDSVRFAALYAGAGGAIEAPIDWAFCSARKPLAELGPVSQDCLELSHPALVPIGEGIEPSGAVPREACRLFGPEPPPAEDGAPAGRPVDPDVTGGYAQPLRLFVPGDDSVALFELRLACGLFGATQAEAAEHAQRYRRNVAPVISALELVHEDGRVISLDEPAEVAPGEVVTLRAGWPSCPESDACGDGVCGIDETRTDCPDDCTTPSSCAGAERFLRFDVASRALVADRESIRAAWYTSGGVLEAERTGVGADDPRGSTENALTVPETEGELTIIVVLRDARGAASWREATLRVVGR